MNVPRIDELERILKIGSQSWVTERVLPWRGWSTWRGIIRLWKVHLV